MNNIIENRFWIIWNPKSSIAPSLKHESKSSAEQEAFRLSKKHPNDFFYILEGVGGRILREPEPEKIVFITCKEASQ